MDKEMRYSKMCNEKPQKLFFSRQNELLEIFSAEGGDDEHDDDVIFSIFSSN